MFFKLRKPSSWFLAVPRKLVKFCNTKINLPGQKNKGGNKMALINCPECEKEISDKVKFCPNCGYPFESENETVQKVELSLVKLKKLILGKRKQ